MGLIKSFKSIFFLSLLWACSSDPEPNVDFLPAREIIDQAYGTDVRQKMDVYLPAGRSRENTPLLVYIHGGAWIDGDKSEFLQFKPVLDNLFPEYALVSVNYRLFDFITGNNKFPTQEADIISVFDFINENLADWNISDRIVISGASAGGHLALQHAYRNDFSDIEAVVAFFPPTDLKELHGFNTITALGLESILGGKPDQIPQAYLDSSPLSHLDPNDPPTIFFHGDIDTVVPISQSELLEENLNSNGIIHQFTRVPNQGHGFTDETYRNLLQQARDFIDAL
ncbi:alpha/beta hydrolase [Algoriphagus confluentis]|uniref:Alpha/beta hydrolase n=2 Tax=Algoriphagus confluentis TaxID=1697556 RepID=A0ABQ6PU45_9BACT|nr:alpha/beta hydrolase [Algoriphagus confluentis]